MLNKFYIFLSSKIGIVLLLFLEYLFLFTPSKLSLHGVFSSTGFMAGTFTAPLILVFVLTRKYHWTKRQIVTNALLITIPYKVLVDFEIFVGLVNIVSMLSLLILIFLIIKEFVQSKIT